MTDYAPPLKDMLFNIHELSGLDRVTALEAFEHVDRDTVDQVVEEAGKFARDVMAPLNVPGDHSGCTVENGAVVPPEGFDSIYQQFVENGWQTLAHSPEYDGMGLPEIVGQAASEAWQSANMAYSLCPMLTNGAISAIDAHACGDLKQAYLPKMVSGEWAGTMNLTEPQAGSDLAAVTAKAEPEGDHYRVSGTKIFITWGDQPYSENVIHLVLARLPDAPEGVRGISLFLVPKFLLNDDGSVGEQNDVTVASVEHKLGIHASPTCVMSFGDNEGAIGYLVGEPNRGLACMFTMMNHARIEVGVQGLAISERAYQLAKAWALDRVQGRAPGVKGRAKIVHHADVRRMLMVMKSQIEAMRAAAYATAGELDLSQHATDEAQRAAADRRMALLTPIVKGWMTEVAQELTSLGVQIHGGMGYVEETGAAQHMRDARILTIYEGTTGIQANDLVGRKILADEGTGIGELIAEMRSVAAEVAGREELVSIGEALATGIDQLEEAVAWLVGHAASDPHLPGAASFNLLMLAGTVVGGWQMARAALAVTSGDSSVAGDKAFCEAKLLTARFYAEQIMPRAAAYLQAATAGTDVLMAMPEDSF
jgi:alkylation response protein AidB-like acyl-CoA dehydrogenase